MSFMHEMKRRKVFRVAAVYGVVGWLLIQVADTVLPRLDVPDWVVTALIVFVLLGFPVAIVLAWALEITPDGVKRTPSESPAESSAPMSLNARLAALAALGAVVLLGLGGWAYFGGASAHATGDRATIASIAVLPFVDMSPEGDQRYFSHGLSEELLNLLAKFEGLRVASRTSSFQYDGESPDVRAIGRDLGVEAVLEGSVRKAGGHIRITAQLIDAATGYHLWSETYDRELTDVFAVQDEIGAAIVAALGFGEAAAPSVERYTDNVAAYELYLRGRYQQMQMRVEEYTTGEAGVLEGIALFERALALDSTYALAWAGIADSYAWFLADNLWAPTRAYPRARDAALRALALDPELSEAHVSLALVKRWFDWDFRGADESFVRAIELDSGNAMAHYHRAALLLYTLDRPREAIEEAGRSIALDSAFYFEGADELMFKALAFLGEDDAALAPLRRSAVGDSTATERLLRLLDVTGRIDEWRAIALDLPEAPPSPTARSSALGRYAVHHAWLGDRAAADSILRVLETRADTTYVVPDVIASIHAALGRPDSAFAWLARAVDARSALLVDGFLDEAAFDPIRGDPRFAALRRRLGLPADPRGRPVP